jgi:hypothetical protein
VLRVMPLPADVNANGDIFGGWIMAQVDLAGAVLPSRIAKGRIATVAVNQFIFKQPVSLGDLLSFYAHVTRIGRTSISVHVAVYAERNPANLQVVKAAPLRSLAGAWRSSAAAAKPAGGRPAALNLGGRACGPTALWCSVLRPRRAIHFVRCAHCVQGPPSQRSRRARCARWPQALRSSPPHMRAAGLPPAGFAPARVACPEWHATGGGWRGGRYPPRVSRSRREAEEPGGARAARLDIKTPGECLSESERSERSELPRGRLGLSIAAQSTRSGDRRSPNPWRVPPAARAAASSHFAPDLLLHALELYRAGFRPSAAWPRPHAMVGVNVVAADTDAQAARLFTSIQQRFLGMQRGRRGPLPQPISPQQMQALWSPQERAAVQQMLAASAVGSAQTVRAQLQSIIDQTAADELIVAGRRARRTRRGCTPTNCWPQSRKKSGRKFRLPGTTL